MLEDGGFFSIAIGRDLVIAATISRNGGHHRTRRARKPLNRTSQVLYPQDRGENEEKLEIGHLRSKLRYNTPS